MWVRTKKQAKVLLYTVTVNMDPKTTEIQPKRFYLHSNFQEKFWHAYCDMTADNSHIWPIESPYFQSANGPCRSENFVTDKSY